MEDVRSESKVEHKYFVNKALKSTETASQGLEELDSLVKWAEIHPAKRVKYSPRVLGTMQRDLS